MSDPGPPNAALNQTVSFLATVGPTASRRARKAVLFELLEFIAYEHANYELYPPWAPTFQAFELTSSDAIKVVIRGEDPYHAWAGERADQRLADQLEDRDPTAGGAHKAPELTGRAVLEALSGSSVPMSPSSRTEG